MPHSYLIKQIMLKSVCDSMVSGYRDPIENVTVKHSGQQYLQSYTSAVFWGRLSRENAVQMHLLPQGSDWKDKVKLPWIIS